MHWSTVRTYTAPGCPARNTAARSGASSMNNIRGVRGDSIGFASQNRARYHHGAMRV